MALPGEQVEGMVQQSDLSVAMIFVSAPSYDDAAQPGPCSKLASGPMTFYTPGKNSPCKNRNSC